VREPEPFKHVGIDAIGPLPLTMRGKRYIILVVDLFTKWIEARAIEEADAQTIATFFYEDIICRHGVPARLTSDRGTEFVNELVSQLIEEYQKRRMGYLSSKCSICFESHEESIDEVYTS